MARLSDTDWTPDFAGERYHARWLLGCHLSAGCNHVDWKGPRAPWSLSIDCTRAEAEALARELGHGEAKAHGSTDASWSYYTRDIADDADQARQLGEDLARRAVERIAAMRGAVPRHPAAADDEAERAGV